MLRELLRFRSCAPLAHTPALSASTCMRNPSGSPFERGLECPALESLARAGLGSVAYPPALEKLNKTSLSLTFSSAKWRASRALRQESRAKREKTPAKIWRRARVLLGGCAVASAGAVGGGAQGALVWCRWLDVLSRTGRRRRSLRWPAGLVSRQGVCRTDHQWCQARTRVQKRRNEA